MVYLTLNIKKLPVGPVVRKGLMQIFLHHLSERVILFPLNREAERVSIQWREQHAAGHHSGL